MFQQEGSVVSLCGFLHLLSCATVTLGCIRSQQRYGLDANYHKIGKTMFATQKILGRLRNCTTRNFRYHLRCKICSQPYVGKTIQMTGSRMCGHRSKLFEIIRKNGPVEQTKENKDEYIPGIHLYNNHGLRDHLTILEKCSPSALDAKEHLWIQKLRTQN